MSLPFPPSVANLAIAPEDRDVDREAEELISGAAEPSEEPKLETPPDDDLPTTEEDYVERRRAAMRAIYGDDFPLAKVGQITSEDWANWAQHLFDDNSKPRLTALRLARYHRLLREGRQWVAPTASGEYLEPPLPMNTSRVTNNIIAPALDQRVQLIQEQRPGFRTRPVSQDPEAKNKAEGQQLFLEYQYDEQSMAAVIAETAYWVGTDGCAFWYVFWDADAGPWAVEQPEQAVQVGEQGELFNDLVPGATLPAATPRRYPMGDVRTRVLRLENVAVSPNATATQRPYFWVVRETVALAEAVALYGTKVVGRNGTSAGSGWADDSDDARFEGQDTTDRYMVFCEPTEFLPDGLAAVVVGNKAVYVGELPIGCVPLVRVTDGSTDPSWFCKATMSTWVDHQLRINAVLSRWVDTVRMNAGGRLLSKARALSNETLVGGMFSNIEVRTAGPIGEAVQRLDPFSIGSDAKELIAADMRAFEQKSGWSSESRGQFGGETSGRAILAAREQVERIFAPGILAMARAMTDWARITLKWGAWGFDEARTLAVMGKGRPDLARQVSREDLDGVSDVEVDAETLTPMPRALRMFLLDQYYDRKIIDQREYRRRAPFAFISNIETPDEDHYARARRVAQAILDRQPVPPIRWQDNEAIHQDVLERMVILRDDLPENIVAQADQRWRDLAQQAQMKNAPPPAPPPTGGGGPGPYAPGPNSQPLFAGNPGLAAAPVAQMTGFADEQAARQFDATRPF